MKKVVVVLIVVLFFVSVIVYFFVPKEATYCGSTLPFSCGKCKCSRGIPFSGIGGMQCLGGKVIECE